MAQEVRQHQLRKKSKPQDPKHIKYLLGTYYAEGLVPELNEPTYGHCFQEVGEETRQNPPQWQQQYKLQELCKEATRRHTVSGQKMNRQ